MELAKRHLFRILKRNTTYDGKCWLINHRAKYSTVKVDGKNYSVHRLSAYLFLGLDIDNQKIQANHKIECTSSNCWNPDHIYVGDQSQNLKDQVIKGTHTNAAKTHCPRGHIYDQVKWKNGVAVARRCSACRKITG